MDRAADLLAEGDLTVRDVAHRVGYRQPAQFAKAFRRRHGPRRPSTARTTGGPPRWPPRRVARPARSRPDRPRRPRLTTAAAVAANP